MAAILEKKWGPYSKDDQEQRRNQVYVFYFENGYSALDWLNDNQCCGD